MGIAMIIIAAIGVAASVAGTIVSGVQSKKDREAAEKQQKELEKAQAAAREALAQYADQLPQLQELERMINGQYLEAEAERVKQFADSITSITDAFGIDSAMIIEQYANAIPQILADSTQSIDEAIKRFNAYSLENIMNYAREQGALVDLTEQEYQLIREQYTANMNANIANYVMGSDLINEETRAELERSIRAYDAEQSARNQLLQETLATSTSNFANIVNAEATLRDKIVGDFLATTGQVLAETNDGVAALLGKTPEENLERSRAAATDFASAFLTQTGMQQGQLAQQQARMSGLPPGQAALMAQTQMQAALQGNWNQAVEIGLGQYNESQLRQLQAEQEKYARQKELADQQIEEAKYSEQIARENAQNISEQERENARIAAEMQQRDAQALADMEQRAAEQNRQAQQRALEEATRMREEQAEREAEQARRDATDIFDARTTLNETVLNEKQNINKEVMDASINEAQANRQAQMDYQKSLSEMQQERAREVADRQRQDAWDINANQADLAEKERIIRQEELDTQRDDARDLVDWQMRLADQQAGISSSTADRAQRSRESLNQNLFNLANSATTTASSMGTGMGQ